MRKRVNSDTLHNEPIRKKSLTLPPVTGENLKQGEILTDITGKKWKLGKTVGLGGFGQIYLASDILNEDVKANSPYVAKVESHSNGPLFVEINCYLRAAKIEMLNKWMEEKNMKHLGMPHYVASGSHTQKGSKYRFLILPRYEKDLEAVLQTKQKFNIKTVVTIATQILDILEYMHDKGFIHSDIKASNILLGQTRPTEPIYTEKVVKKYRICNPVRTCRYRRQPRNHNTRINLRPPSEVNYVDDVPNFDEMAEDEEVYYIKQNKVVPEDRDQVYLLDYGLATKYINSQNEHKQFCHDERRAHAGTLLFCSRDAHNGTQSRRSDLESLGYNMIYWLGGLLPWSEQVDPEIVHKMKQKCIADITQFLKTCFSDYPKFLMEYFKYLQKLEFQEKPNYGFCRKLFISALKEYGYTADNKFDFDNKEGWGQKQKKIKKNSENHRVKKHYIHQIQRFPLQSNLPVKPKLRKKTNKQIDAQLKWSRILMDPEFILKQGNKVRDRKMTESSDSNPGNSIFNMDIHKFNPTYAMIEVYNKSKERLNGSCNNSPAHKNDEFLYMNGYTPAMLAVHNQMKERKEMERKLLQAYDKSSNKKNKIPVITNITRKRSVNIVQSPPKTRLKKATNMKTINTCLKLSKRKEKITSKRSYSLRG